MAKQITATSAAKTILRRRSVSCELAVVDKEEFSHTSLGERKRFCAEGTED